MPPERIAMARARQRGVVADAMLGAGATVLLLQGVRGASAWTIAVAVLLLVAGAALLWGVPRPTFRLRMTASLAGLLLGFAIATAESGTGAFVSFLTGIALLMGCLGAARGSRVVRRFR